MLINGRKVDCEKSSLSDCIYIKNDLINLPKNNKNKILLSIIEFLKLEVNCSIEIKAIAHTDNCKKIYFEATGKSKDCIETLLMNKCCIPANYDLNNNFIEVDHCLNANVNPNFIFIIFR